MAKITITDLANRLGVSVCTVNKALSGKPKVSDKTRRRVLAEAERLGYRPNRMAQALAHSPIRMAYLHADHFPSFFGPFESGVNARLARLADQRVSVTFHSLDPAKWNTHLLPTVESLVDDGLSGLIVSPISGVDYAPAWTLLAERRIPLVQLGLEVPDSPAVFTVRQDTLLSGRIAAELLSHFNAPVAVMIGNRRVVDHDEKLRGFQAEAERRDMTIVQVYEHEDDPELSYQLVRRLFREHPAVGGLYVATDNFTGVYRGLRKRQAASRLKVVTTGTFPEIRDAMDQNLVHFSLDQRMAEQGELAVRRLHDVLLHHRLEADKVLLQPRVVVRGNL